MGRFSKRLARAFHYGEKGFTLIELLIVVAILGILAAVIIPNVSSFMVTGRLNAANTEVENIKTAELAYYAEYGGWAASTSTANFTNYYSGTLGNGVTSYTFDTNFGWVMSATPATTNGITFTGATGGASGGSGKWVRAP